MKIIVNGSVEIKLPDIYITSGDGKTCNIETSFLAEFKKCLTKHGDINQEEKTRAFCLNKMQEVMSGGYKSHFEIMGGVGVTASIFGKDGAEVTINELDETCVEVLKNNFPDWNISTGDMFKYDYKNKFDSIFLDFNNFTIKKHNEIYRGVMDDAFANAEKFMLVNDCSVFYLSRGEKSFQIYSKLLGETVTCYEDYFPAVKRYYKKAYPNWDLTNIIWFHSTTYCLFRPTSDENENNLEIQKFSSEDENKDPVLKLYYQANDKKLFCDLNKDRLWKPVLDSEGKELVGSYYVGNARFVYREGGEVRLTSIGSFGKTITNSFPEEIWDKLKTLNF